MLPITAAKVRFFHDNQPFCKPNNLHSVKFCTFAAVFELVGHIKIAEAHTSKGIKWQ